MPGVVLRPSPTESATLFPVGTKRRGNDGRTYVVASTKAGVRRWVPHAAAAGRVGATSASRPSARVSRVSRRVYIVDNGGIPMVVELIQGKDGNGGGVARVLRQREGISYEQMDRTDRHDVSRQSEWLERWRDFRYTRAFVGLDPSEEKKKKGWFGRVFSPSWWEGGSSVLLELGPRRYLCICGNEGVFEFRTPPGDEIERYVSVMGNSAVTYPYAVGAKNTYLMIENVFMSKELATKREDPYDVFYNTDIASGAEVKSMPKRQAIQAAYRAMHRIPGMKSLHPRHEPDMV